VPDPAGKRDVLRRHAARSRDEHGREAAFDLASGWTRPFASRPASLRELEDRGLLYGPAVNKLTLMNYVTPATVRALEWIGALIPELPHIYLTSSRDETIDKALRMFKVTRKEAQIAIGLEGGYYGHTVASCRSLSDPSTHRGGSGHFNWPRAPHPAVAGTDATIKALREIVTSAGTAKILGFVYEIVQERTGLVLPKDFMPALAALRKELDFPLIAV